MTIEVLTLCDYVQHVGDKLNVIGTFNIITTDNLSMPFTFHIVARFRYTKEEFGDKDVFFKMVSPSGAEVLKGLKATCAMAKTDEPFMSTTLSLCLANFVFAEYGVYKILVETDGMVHELPLNVKQPLKP